MNVNSISNQTIVRVLTVAFGFMAAMLVAFLLRHELALVGLAFFLAVAINPLVELISKRLPKRSRGLAVGLVFSVIVLMLVLMISQVLPLLVTQSQSLVHDLPLYIGHLETSDSLLARYIVSSDIANQIRNNQSHLLEQLFTGSGSVVKLIQDVFHSLFSALTTLTLTAFMIIEGPRWMKRFWEMQSEAKRRHRQKLAEQMYRVVVRYVSVNLLFGLAAAVMVSALLLVLGVPFAIPLGFITGVLELIPIVGAILATAVVVVACLLHSINAAIIMGLFFFVYQHLKGNILHPLILGRTIPLSPLGILISVLFGVTLGGIVGALVAIPIGGCAQILISDYFSDHRRS